MIHSNKSANSTLRAREKVYLKSIGLSKHAVRLYELLLKNEVLSAQEAAELRGGFASAQYRLFYELEQQSLVLGLPGRPRQFKAVSLREGLQASLLAQQKELAKVINAVDIEAAGQASILIGRQKVYDVYAQYARRAERQICIYAIGIAYSKELAKVQAAAVKRGVMIRHVVQEVKAANYYVISRWLKLGIALRTLQRPRGYHLTIVDDSCAIVTFSNPADTEQRFSLLTTDKNVIAILQAQFEPIWQRAKPLV